MAKIQILGAGISGLTAAINLVKAGYKVCVYEKMKDVGIRFKGDLEGLENWSERKDIVEEIKEIGIRINFDCDPFSNVTVTNGTKQGSVSANKPFFYLVKRGSFKQTLDYGLKQQAEEIGVEIKFGETISQSRVDIVATGPLYKEILGVDKGIVFKTRAKDKAVLLLNDEMAYEGYSYLMVTKGYGCICSVVVHDLNKVNECFKNTKEFFMKKYRLNIQSAKSAGGIGSFALKHVISVKHKEKETFYVGEAAGLQDFSMGFGMRYAFQSGHLAAQCIINNEDYEILARRKFDPKLKASMVNRYIWEKLRRTLYSFVVNYPNFSVNRLHMLYNFNPFHRIMYPVARDYLKRTYPQLEL